MSNDSSDRALEAWSNNQECVPPSAYLDTQNRSQTGPRRSGVDRGHSQHADDSARAKPARTSVAFATHCVHPDEARRVVSLAQDNSVHRGSLFGVGVDLDWLGVLEAGAAGVCYLRHAEIVLDSCGLIAAGRTEDLAAGLRALAEAGTRPDCVESSEEIALCEAVCRDDRARLTVEAAKLEANDHRVEAAIVLSCGLADPSTALQVLGEPSEDATARELAVWVNIGGSEGLARKILDSGPAWVRRAGGDCDRAEGWLLCFGDVRKAVGRMLRAEDKARDADDWLTCAEGWCRLFGDRGRTRACLERAVGHARSAIMLAACGAHCLSLTGDADQAAGYIRSAEGLATSVLDLSCCARRWLQLGVYEREVLRCLEKMEHNATCACDLLRCAELWSQLPGREATARSLMQRAEVQCNRSEDYSSAAFIWHCLPDSKEEVDRCLAEAVGRATTVWELTTVTGIHWRLRRDSQQVRGLLSRAEEQAGNFCEWSHIASAWAQTIGDTGCIARCAARADALS